jgi:hypothetical protein
VQIPVTTHEVRLGARGLRVLRPAGPPLRAALRCHTGNYSMLAASGAALQAAVAWKPEG